MIDAFLHDSSHFPGGHAAGVVEPRTLEDVIAAIRAHETVLPVGAQSSLTGGATPMGETVLATTRLTRIVSVSAEHITVEPGVTVAAMQGALAPYGSWFPPAPTYTGACAGGIAATNAAGAATFKYGTTRQWVARIQVALADGTVLDLKRGDHVAHDGVFALRADSGELRIPVPTYHMPEVPKHSAGYYARPGMDLVDLFVGSEGTLGVMTEIEFRALPDRPAIALAFVPCPSEAEALALVGRLRADAAETWQSHDPHGIDVAAIEHMDRRSLQIAAEDGALRRHNVAVPDGTEVALLIQLELGASLASDVAYKQIATALDAGAADSALARFCRTLEHARVLDVTELALPDDRRRIDDLIAVRESVPEGVNQRVGVAQRDVDPAIHKTAGDMIVPFARFAEMMAIYRAGFESRGLDYAIWGHISDGNVHPNVIPRSLDDVRQGTEAMLAFGRAAVALGGCPLAEHGVGRNAVKQQLLRAMYGERGIEEMRAVKRALDPAWKLAPGVIFPR